MRMTERESELEDLLRAACLQLEAARLENRLLREKIDALVRQIYGPKSERLDRAQLTLLEDWAAKKADAPLVVEAAPKGAHRSSSQPRRPGPRVPEHLPMEEVILDPQEVTADPSAWRLMGQEVSEQLDYRPARFLCRRLIRRKYARRDQPYAAPTIAPLPPSLQERCLATPELMAQVVISKYVDHCPLYRQEQIYRQRHQVELPRQTLCRWVSLAAD